MKWLLFIWAACLLLCGSATAQLAGGLMFPGPGLSISSTPFSISYISTANNTAGSSSYTFAAQNIGTADPTRIIVVAITGGVNNFGVGATVTVGGNNATQAASAAGTSPDNSVKTDIWYYADAGALGTSTTIVVNWTGGQSRCAIAVFSVIGTGASFSTANNNGANAVTSISATATVPSGGGAIVIHGSHSTTQTGFTPTNWSTDLALTAYGSNSIAAGHTTSASGSTAFSETWTNNASVTTSVATFTQ